MSSKTIPEKTKDDQSRVGGVPSDRPLGSTAPSNALKSTPGPWWPGPHYKSDVESRFGRICECGITRGAQAEANARLIAAAPELLDALTELVATSVTDSDSCVYCRRDANKHASGCPITGAYTALAKAVSR